MKNNEIDIYKFIEKNCELFEYDGNSYRTDDVISDALLKFGKQLLKLVCNNIKFIETTSEELNSKDYVPFITASDNTIWIVDEKSIKNTIKQVKL